MVQEDRVLVGGKGAGDAYGAGGVLGQGRLLEEGGARVEDHGHRGAPSRQEPVLAQDGRSRPGGVLLSLHPEVEVVGAPHEGDQERHVGDVPVVELALGETDYVGVLES